jgi:hypothetical protein
MTSQFPGVLLNLSHRFRDIVHIAPRAINIVWKNQTASSQSLSFSGHALRSSHSAISRSG